MIRIIKIIALIVLICSCHNRDFSNIERIIFSELSQVKEKDIIREYLEEIFKTDQNIKLENTHVPKSLEIHYEKKHYEKFVNHELNIERVKQIYKLVGYPKIEKYGEIAESVFWAVPQHDSKIENTIYFSQIMKIEYDKGNLADNRYLWYLRRRLIHLKDSLKLDPKINETQEIEKIENYLFANLKIGLQ